MIESYQTFTSLFKKPECANSLNSFSTCPEVFPVITSHSRVQTVKKSRGKTIFLIIISQRSLAYAKRCSDSIHRKFLSCLTMSLGTLQCTDGKPHEEEHLIETHMESITYVKDEDRKALEYKPASHRVSLRQILSLTLELPSASLQSWLP